MSPPARGRGLKQQWESDQPNTYNVAPRAGAWIETFLPPYIQKNPWSPPARGRGLKHLYQ